MAFKLGLNQYRSLLKVLLINSLSFSKEKGAKVDMKPIKKVGQIGVAILLIWAVVGVLGYLILNAVELTKLALDSNLVKELHYGFIAVAQISVMFFGIAGLINNLYFAKDTQTLLGLPMRNGVVFGAKLTVTYLGELLFSSIIYLPLATASAIFLMNSGYAIDYTFFISEIFIALFIPIVPLLVSTLISQPIMWVVSKLKNRSLGSTIGMAICYVAFFILYFALIMGVSSMSEQGALSSGAIAIFVGLKKGTIFNYPLIEALFGNKVALNLFLYFIGMAIILAVAILLTLVFYRNSIKKFGEGEGRSASKIKSGSDKANSFIKSFLMKDFKFLLSQSQLLLNVIITIIVPFIAVFFIKTGFSNDMEGSASMNNEVFLVAMTTYLMSLISCVGNPFGYVGFSLEGKNLYVLKSMPISARSICKAKLLFASCITAIVALGTLIMFPIVSGITNPIVIICQPIQILVMGVSFNVMALYSDLKKPNLNWNNVNELTRNNFKVLKPMLLSMGLAFAYLIIGILLAVFSNTLGLGDYLIYGIYYVVCLIAPVIIFAIFYKKLLNAEEVLEGIGG